MKSLTLLDSVRRRLIDACEPVGDASLAAAVRGNRDAPLAASAVLSTARRVGDDLLGAGPLQALLDDPQVTDVLVNGPAEVWADRGDGLRRLPIRFSNAAAVRALATRLAAGCGRRLDDSHPTVDACLRDGTRLHAVLPPIAVTGPYLSLRTHRARAFDLPALRSAGTLDPASARLVADIVAARVPFLISGGTGSGKTTLLATLLGQADAGERLVIVEDATELAVDHPHALSLQSRRANVEGAGTVDLRQLVRQSLRMRPDRIIVGECRGGEVIDLLTAMNTGHDGCAGTLHANAPSDVPARLAALALPHGVPPRGLHALIAAALRVIIHMGRDAGRRVVQEICLLSVDASRSAVAVVPAWHRDLGLRPAFPVLRGLLDDRLSAAATPREES
ncbi:MAG TPA: TadA family conjugal transfer-associated ATPase [Stackebrandtia sp.]|jgi:pilus assembly protein CpaF|uniref:TadA family conjugal transfer-associated ATPase n=1 Tax=Stackebrandtia sp. TaxID=2023065 RepID=UPI002D4160CE|nr:TadA family conjugal transfer-associated ATPase [Stackebrandtia sp.]HZE41787.1 TadA family conjugal transfer-associated ATPase [Stackebrandtia sp.]